MEAQPRDSPSSKKASAVTGSGRKIKDNAADWHNLILRWEKLNDEGSSLATNTVNLRLAQKDDGTFDRQMESETSKLLQVLHKMAAVVGKMERLLLSQRGIVDLEKFQFGAEGRTSPLFHSWKTHQFEGVCASLLEAYRQELKLKQLVVQELAHSATSDLGLVLVSCWIHQPYLPPQARLTLESLLLETGHRPL